MTPDAIKVGAVDIVRVFVGATTVWEAGGGGPLADAVVADDFRTMSDWDANWDSSFFYPQDNERSNWTWGPDGAEWGGEYFDAAAGFTRNYFFLGRDLPDGTDLFDSTYVFHYSTATPTGVIWPIELAVTHDPDNQWDGEVTIGTKQPSLTRPARYYLYAYSDTGDADSGNGGDINLAAGTGNLPADDYVVIWYTDADGIHARFANADRTVDASGTAPWDPPPEESLTTLNRLRLNSFAATAGDATLPPFTFKGFYVLPAALTSADDEDAIIDSLLS